MRAIYSIEYYRCMRLKYTCVVPTIQHVADFLVGWYDDPPKHKGGSGWLSPADSFRKT